MQRIARLGVFVPDRRVGLLEHTGRHAFSYAHDVLDRPDCAISLTMPMRVASYEHTPMLPALQTFLPEGYLADRIRDRFGKTIKMDDMAMLALSAGEAIGRLRVAIDDAIPSSKPTIALRELLADHGNRALFDELCERYLFGSAVAGVHPKVLLTADVEDVISASNTATSDTQKLSLEHRGALRVGHYIVKAGETDLPNLVANEFHCLSIAKRASLDVPQFWLSNDEKRLIVERFDRIDGKAIGFEDMVSLQGKQNNEKYEGRYETIAKAIRLNASPAHLQSSLQRFFERVVLSVLLRDGDAHLKNFGLLYTSPASVDCRFAPVYDVVTTTMYLPNDRMALSLQHERHWPDDNALAQFGKTHCALTKPTPIIERIRQAIADYRPAQAIDVWRTQREALARKSS